MQLIKDFADIPRFVSFLNSDYQQKLLGEINSLLIRFMDEQTKGIDPNAQVSSTSAEPVNQAVEVPAERASVIKPIQSSGTQSSPESLANINNLKSAFTGKGGLNIPPPPPPLQTIAAVPHQRSRSITAGTLNIKTGSSLPASKAQNKKPVLSLVDSWAFITPHITELGEEELKKPSIKTDVYQLLRNINNQSSLKELYLYLNPNSNTWAKFLEMIYPLYRERCVNLKKNRDFPGEIEIPVRIGDFFVSKNMISNEDLEKAIAYQKNPPPPSAKEPTPQIIGGNWMDRAKSLIGQNEISSAPPVQKKLGEVLLDLKMITREELDHALTIQKWIRNILDHAK